MATLDNQHCLTGDGDDFLGVQAGWGENHCHLLSHRHLHKGRTGLGIKRTYPFLEDLYIAHDRNLRLSAYTACGKGGGSKKLSRLVFVIMVSILKPSLSSFIV
jgi:hypothetical protein